MVARLRVAHGDAVHQHEGLIEGATAQADSQIREEMRNVGLDLAMANALDAATLLMLLGSPVLDARRAFGVAALLQMDALRARADGDESRAARSIANALALLQAARPMLDGERADLAVQIIEELRARGKSVVLVSHDLEFVFTVADRIQVMRLGRVRGVRRRADTDRSEIVGLITGALAADAVDNGAQP